jgi:hypothetical protein
MTWIDVSLPLDWIERIKHNEAPGVPEKTVKRCDTTAAIAIRAAFASRVTRPKWLQSHTTPPCLLTQ